MKKDSIITAVRLRALARSRTERSERKKLRTNQTDSALWSSFCVRIGGVSTTSTATEYALSATEEPNASTARSAGGCFTKSGISFVPTSLMSDDTQKPTH